MTFTIKSMEVPTTTTDDDDTDWFHFLSFLGCQESRSAGDEIVEHNFCKTEQSTLEQYGCDQLLEDNAQDLRSTIVEFKWIDDPAMFSLEDASPRSSSVRDFLELPEMLSARLSDSLPASTADLLDLQPISTVGFRPLNVTHEPNFDFQLFTSYCLAEEKYDCTDHSSLEALYGVIESGGNTHQVLLDKVNDELTEFEEFMFLDLSFSIHRCLWDVFDCSSKQIHLDSLSTLLTTETCFEELIVQPDLRTRDDKVYSISVPMFPECSSESLLLIVVVGLTLHCKLALGMATDNLYLDWHFVQETMCNDAECFKLRAKLDNNSDLEPIVVPCNVSPNIRTWSEIVIQLAEKGGDSREGASVDLEFQEMELYAEPAVSFSPTNNLHVSLQRKDKENAGTARTRDDNIVEVIDHQHSNHEAELLSDYNYIPENVLATEKLSSPLGAESMVSNPGDIGIGADLLTCFVQARKGILQCPRNIGLNGEWGGANHETDHDPDEKQLGEDVPIKFSVHEETIKLSAEIQTLLSTLSSDYENLLKDSIWTTATQEMDMPRTLGFDGEGNFRLMTLMKELAGNQNSPHQVLRALAALHALRHTAFNLCTYGVQVAHLYLENLFDRVAFLEELILMSRVELEDAYNKVETGVSQDHPKLLHLENLLRGQTSSDKILLTADRRAFFTLYKRVLSSGCTPYQIDRKEDYLHKGSLVPEAAVKLREDVTAALSFANCLLVPSVYVTDSFPLDNFNIIIHYAPCSDEPAVQKALQKAECEQYVLHVLVNPESLAIPSQISQRPASDNERTELEQDEVKAEMIARVSGSNDEPRNMGSSHSSGQVKTSFSGNVTVSGPQQEKCNMVRSLPGDGSSLNSNEYTSPEQHMIVVANICERTGYNLTGRRTLYQKIVFLEKQGIQVVERELRLPIHLIFSPANCLLIYKQPMSEHMPQRCEEKKSLREDIDVLMKAISFAYANCTMIFEGPDGFTSDVVANLCDIYATALWLELEVQCFISNGLDMTERLIINCIEAARRSQVSKPFPAMTETPSIAEVFLTEFPSMNPLSAHAVLSSACPLKMFILMSLEHQYALVQGWDVPKHCLELFKAQCTYREAGNAVRPECEVLRTPVNQQGYEFLTCRKIEGMNEELVVSSVRETPDQLTTYEQGRDAVDTLSNKGIEERLSAFWGNCLKSPSAITGTSGLQIECPVTTVPLQLASYRDFPSASEITNNLAAEPLESDVLENDTDEDTLKMFNATFMDEDLDDPPFSVRKSNKVNKPECDEHFFSTASPRNVKELGWLQTTDCIKPRFDLWDNFEDHPDAGLLAHEVNLGYSSLDFGRLLGVGELNLLEEEKAYCHERKTTGMMNSLKQTGVQSLKPFQRTTLLQTSLDRFRHKSNTSKVSNSVQSSLLRAAPNQTGDKQVGTKRTVSDRLPVKQTKKMLGLARQGSDRQQRLVSIPKNNSPADVHPAPKRSKTVLRHDVHQHDFTLGYPDREDTSKQSFNSEPINQRLHLLPKSMRL